MTPTGVVLKRTGTTRLDELAVVINRLCDHGCSQMITLNVNAPTLLAYAAAMALVSPDLAIRFPEGWRLNGDARAASRMRGRSRLYGTTEFVRSLLGRKFGHEGFASQSVLERRQQDIFLVEGSGLGCGAATAACGDERITQRPPEGKEETAPTQDTPLTPSFNDRREHAC